MEQAIETVEGVVVPGWEPVRDAFMANFEANGEIGAATAVYHRGTRVVDLWGGLVEPGGAPYTADTLQLVFSTTKGAVATCAAMLIERGDLDVDAPVRHYWPEFAAAGKHDIPVRMLLTHESGLYDVDGELALGDALAWDPVVEALAAQEPLWSPGSQHGYHAITYGYLVGEVIRRVSGRSVGQFFAEAVARPLGLEFWIGLPDAHQDRVAPMLPFEAPEVPEVADMMAQLMGPESTLGRALAAPGGAFRMNEEQEHEPFVFNRPEVRAAEIPAANGVTNARSLAKMYAAVVGEVDGVRLFEEPTLERVGTPHTEGADVVLMFMDIQFGLGFMKPSSMLKMGGPRSVGHYGAGGSVGFADPDAELGFGYVMNRMDLGLAGDPRSAGLIDAALEVAGSQ